MINTVYDDWEEGAGFVELKMTSRRRRRRDQRPYNEQARGPSLSKIFCVTRVFVGPGPDGSISRSDAGRTEDSADGETRISMRWAEEEEEGRKRKSENDP